MSYMYPTDSELNQAERDLEDILKMPLVQQIIEEQQRKRAETAGIDLDSDYEQEQLPKNFYVNNSYDLSYGRQSFVPTNEDTYDKPYAIDDIDRMLVARTSQLNPITFQTEIIEANPNDPAPIFELMSRVKNNNRDGTLETFEAHGCTTTSRVSQFFAAKAMNDEYERRGLNPGVVADAASSEINVIEMNFPMSEAASFLHAAANPEFHRVFHKNFLLQMNHRLVQEALEKNRQFDMDGEERLERNELGKTFTWGNFEKIAAGVAKDAFDRSMYFMELQRVQQQVKEDIKSIRQKFNETLKPKIISEGFVESFGREFKARQHETGAQAAKRIYVEYKDFSVKKHKELEGKGIEIILAQGIATSERAGTVGQAHFDEARAVLARVKADPFRYNSTEAIFKEVAGNNPDLVKSMLHSLDGRSTFQKSLPAVTQLGMRLHASKEDRTRVRKADAPHGHLFAANVLRGVQPGQLDKSMAKTMAREGYSVEQAMDARKRMQKSVGRITDDRGQDTNRDRILRNVAPAAERRLERDEGKPEYKPSWKDRQDDSGGPSPDGDDSPSKGKGRRR